jgi:rhodanese-related sulfurtransferase
MRLLRSFAVAVVITSCASPAPPPSPSPPAAASQEQIDGATAHALVRDGAALVDVRGPDEYAAGHIEGAINVPAQDVASHDFGGTSKPIVLYCARGHRSQQAGEVLRSHGYTRVFVLGPMSAWGQ